jgi:hypothetical protein
MSTSLYQKTSLTSSSFVGKAVAAAALVATGYYLYDSKKESLNLKDDANIPSWTLFRNPGLLLIVWTLVLIILVLVWHQLMTVMGLTKDQMDAINLLMVSLLVLFFTTIVSFTNGSINNSMWLTIASALGAAVAAAFLYSIKESQSALVLGVLSGFLVYRAISLNALREAKEKLEQPL